MKQTFWFISLAAAAAVSPSMHDSLYRRADNVRSHMNVGSKKINYGTMDPQLALKKIADACPAAGGPCDETPIQIPVSLGLDSGTLEIKVSGEYPNQEQRDHFMNAIIAAAGVGTIKKKEPVCNSPINVQQVSCQDMTFFSQTGFIGIQRFLGDTQGGSMSVTMTLKEEDNKWCEIALGLTEVLIGTLSGTAAEFFGTVDSGDVCKSF